MRGCDVSLEQIKILYRELREINRQFGAQIIATLTREANLSDEEWEARKDFLLDDAFSVTVTIRGQGDQQHYGESVDIFSGPDLPSPIKSIFFSNITAWKRHSPDNNPPNAFVINLDFTKPKLFDPSIAVSSETPNESHFRVEARDLTFFRAVQRVVQSKLLAHRTWYNPIHKDFAYDVGIWLATMPAGLILATYYMDEWLPLSGANASYRWAFFMYALGLVLLAYRFLNAYARWAFPVNVLRDNQDRALKHRIVLSGVVMWIVYKVADVLYGLVFP